jgi:DNA mismatch repair protein MutL
MAIIALPSTTTCLLNSTQVLTTPASLIKELIDNALDAKATSIDILISPNALDKVEVRDNGHGIQLEDLDSLGRRGHTSKLRSFEELKLLVGVTLGFRGEALASAVQLGEVLVTTKTEGESVATTVKLKATGGIDYQARTSHPVGTTVSVKNLMAKLPVRKRIFEKEAAKTLSKVHRLLQAYALARPSIRLSLKIAKGGKGSWSFLPHQNCGVREAALRIIGRDAVLQCINVTERTNEVAMQVDEAETTHLTSENVPNRQKEAECFTFEAFLPIPNADPSKIGSGQYLSVDSRPVSHEKGTMKKIVGMFKKYVKASLNLTTELKAPFICLNIKCPVASYDANVEPAKDNVLFTNENVVLEAVEKLLNTVYGDCIRPRSTSTLPLLTNELDGLGPPLVRKSPTVTIESGHSSEQQTPTAATEHVTKSAWDLSRSSRGQLPDILEDGCVDGVSSKPQKKWGFNMSEDFTRQVEGSVIRTQVMNNGADNTRNMDNQAQSEQITHLNPWNIAKATVPSIRDTATTLSNSNSVPILTPATPKLRKPPESSSKFLNLSNTRVQQTLNSEGILTLQPIASIVPPQPLIIPVRHTVPDSSSRHSFTHDTESGLFIGNNELPCPSTGKNDFVTARSILQNPLISPPSTQISKAPFGTSGPGSLVLPFEDMRNRTEPSSVRQTKLLPYCQFSRKQIGDERHISSNPDLAWAMDFERRKEDATRRRREEVRGSRKARAEIVQKEIRSSPYRNRHNMAPSNLEGKALSHPCGPEQMKKSFETSLADDDPRAYLMRRQRSMVSQITRLGGPPKMMRAKSTRLPLETVPPDTQLQHLVQSLRVEVNTLRRVALILSRGDTCTSHISGLVISSEEVPELARRFQTAVKEWTNGIESKEFEVEYTFGRVFNDK